MMAIYVGKGLVQAIKDERITEKNMSQSKVFMDYVCDKCGAHTSYAVWASGEKRCRKCGYHETEDLDGKV
jgi:ribosomal protein L40E